MCVHISILYAGNFMKKRRIIFGIITACMVAMALTGCKKKEKEPVVLSVWHVYGAQTDSPLNAMVDEFNATVGKEKNITVQVTQISNTNTIHKAVLAGANKEPGAAELPDIFVSYPKTVLAMPDQSVLVDFNDYFTQEELDKYVSAFINEGYVDGRLVVFPVAKSTEILFVDKTLFDRFSAATGVKMTDLTTWEGLFDASVKYYRWTDSLTPDVENDGKNMFVHDYPFNYLQVGVESLGQDFFNNNAIAFGSEFEKVWTPYAKAAIMGGVWLSGGYATEALRTGEAIISIASSASVLYYEDQVIYSNNESEDIEVVSMSVPVFKNGSNIVMQRGAGLCVTKSTKEREEAAVEFVKWLTSAQNNVKFVTDAGYMPVTNEGFDLLPAQIEKITNKKYKSLYEAFVATSETYTFYTAPQFSEYLSIESAAADNVRELLKKARTEYLEKIANLTETGDALYAAQEKIAEQLAKDYMKKYIDSMK